MGLFSLDGIDLEDAPADVIPLCPGCRRKLDRVWVKSQGFVDSSQQVLLCPHCHVWLGYANNRR